jgi:Na+/H+-dicarboxylate symporter
VRRLGRLGGWTLGYYFSTCAAAVLIGILLVLVIRPGAAADDTYSYTPPKVQEKEDAAVLDTLLDVFRGKEEGGGMFPKNLFQAATNTNVLGLLMFALLFGGALTMLGEKGKVAIDFFHAANEAVMKLVHLVMFVAPIGIYGLVATKIAENGGGPAFGEELGRLARYAMTVLVGLGIHSVLLAALLPLLARRNPFVYTYNMLRSLLTAMSTASSSATLPVTFECVEENNRVSNRSAGFVLPLGATINMDGTALYEAVAVIFIAQSIGLELSMAQLVVIFLTATLAAIGAAGIPEAGLVTMVIVLTAAGVPTTGIGTILAIDWFLDRMRTTVNVYGDSVGAAVVDRNVVQKAR